MTSDFIQETICDCLEALLIRDVTVSRLLKLFIQENVLKEAHFKTKNTHKFRFLEAKKKQFLLKSFQNLH